MADDLKKLYDGVSSQVDIGDYNTFVQKMQTPQDRKKFYDAVSGNGLDLGDYNSYEQRLGGVKKKDVTTPLPKPLQQNGLRSGLVSPLNLNGQSYYRAPLVAPIENTNLGIDVGGMVQKSVTPKTNTTDEVPLLSNQPQRQQVSAQNKSDNLNPAPSVQAQAQILGLKSQAELNADEQSKQLAEYLNVNGKDLGTFDPIEFKKALGKVNGEEERKHFIGADMHSYQSDVDAYNKVGSILERNIDLAKADIDAKYGAGAFARYQKQKTSFGAELEGKLPQIDAIDAQLKELTERKPRTVQEFQANKQLLAQLEQQRKDIVAPLQQVQEQIQQAEQQTEFQKLKYLGEAQQGLTVKQQSLLDKYPSAKATLQSNEKLQSWIDNTSKKLSATAKSGGTGVGDVPLVLLGDALKTVTGLAHKLSSIPQTVEKAFGVQDNVFLTPFNFATGLINDATAIVDDKAKNLIPTNLQLPVSQKYKLVDGNKIFLDKNDKPTFVRDADGYKVDPKQEQLAIEQYNQMPNKSKVKTEDNTDWGVALNDATKFGMDIVAMGQMGRGLSALGLAGTPAKTWANGTLTLMGYGLNDAYEGAKQSAPNLTDQQAAQYALGSQTAIGAIFGLLGGAKMKYITGEGGESVFSKMKDYLSKNNAFKLTVEDIKAIDGGASAFQVGKAKIQKAIGEGLLQGGEMGIIMPSITAVANNVTNTMVGYDALDGNLVIDKESLTNSALPAILVGIVTGGMSVNGSTLKNQAWGNINKNEQTVNSTIEFLDKSVEDGLYTPTQAYNIKERIRYTQENIKPLDGSLNAVEHKALSNLYDNKFQLQKQADKFTDSGAKKAYTDKIRDIDNDIAQIINKKEDFKSNITTSVMDNGVKENEVVKPVADVNIQQEEVKVNQVEVPLDIVDESVQKPASEMDEQQVNQLYEQEIVNPTVEEEQNPFLDKLRKKTVNEAEITPNELVEQGGEQNVGEGLQGEYQNNQGVQQGSGIGQVSGQEVPTEKVEEGANAIQESSKKESAFDIVAKEEEIARKKQQADKDKALLDIELIKSGDTETIDKYFKKSGYKEITGNETDTRLKGKKGVYKNTGASIIIKKSKTDAALDSAINISNKKIQGLSNSRIEEIVKEFQPKQPTVPKTETTDNPALKDVESTAKALSELPKEKLRDYQYGVDMENFRESLSESNKKDWDELMNLEFDKNANKKRIKELRDKFKPLEQKWFSENDSNSQRIAEQYHQNKADGTNPEHVKAVEEALTPTPEVSKPVSEVADNGEGNIGIEDNYNSQIEEKGFADVFIPDDLVINGVPKNTYKVRINKDGGIVYYDENGKEVGKNKRATKDDFILISKNVVDYFKPKEAVSKGTDGTGQGNAEGKSADVETPISKTETTKEGSGGVGGDVGATTKALEEVAKKKPNASITFINKQGYEQKVNLNDTYEFTQPEEAGLKGETIKGFRNQNNTGIIPFSEVAEAYHKAKADGSNPELVKAVEEALTPQTENTKSNEEQPTNSEKGKKTETVAEISPNKNVSASKASAIKDLIADKYSDLKEMEASVLANMDGTELVDDLLDYVNWSRATQKGGKFKAKGLKGSAILKLAEKGYIEEPSFTDDNITLTDKGKKFQDALKARQETRKGIKEGTDLFPKDAGLSGKELVGDALDRIATKLGGKKNLTEQERTSLTKDISDLAKGLIQMGSATLDNVIDKIKEAIKKRVPELSDKEIDALAENIEDKVLLSEAVNWYKDKGYTYEQAKARLDKIDADYNDADLREMFDDKVEVTEEDGKEKVKKTTLTFRAYEGTFRDEVKKELEKFGLIRERQSFQEAEQQAKDIIERYGLDTALEIARSGDIGRAQSAEILNAKIEQTEKDWLSETDPQKLDELNKAQAEAINEYDQFNLDGGRGSAQIAHIMEKSDLGYNVEKKINDFKEQNGGEIPAEVEKKFRELDAEYKEVKAKLIEAEKRAVEAEGKLAIDNIKESIVREKKIRTTSKRGDALITEGLNELKGLFASFKNDKIGFALDPKKQAEQQFENDRKLVAALSKIGKGLIDKSIATVDNVFEKIKEYVKSNFGEKVDIDKHKDDIVTGIKSKMPKATIKEGKVKVPHQLIRDLVESGIEDIDALSAEIKKQLESEFPDVTIREIRDGITDYGRTVNPNREEIEAQIRKMKRIGKAISGLEDVRNKKRPLRSGVQRDKPDTEERAKQKELREAMKELPVDAETLENQLKTQLDAEKTRIQNRIDDLKSEIAKGEQVPRNARTSKTDAELVKLKAELEKVKAEHDEKFKNDDYKEKKRLELSKKLTNNRIQELQRRLNENDFSKKVIKPLIADSELVKLRADKLRIQEQYDKEFYKNKLQNRTKEEKIKDAVLEAWGLTRALGATGEFSFVLVQGGLNSIAHPLQAAQAMKRAIQFMGSEAKTEKWLREIKSQEWYPAMKQAKLSLTETHAEMSAREELFVSDWTSLVWNVIGAPLRVKPNAYEAWKRANPFKALERAAVGYLDTIRVLRFLDGMEMLKEKGFTPEKNPQEYKDMADVINTLTGRASLGKLEQNADVLAKVFFSPRNWASMLKQTVLLPRQLYKWRNKTGEPGFSVANKMALADFSKYLGVTTSMVMLFAAALNNDDNDETGVELDPRSSDFGKIKIGKKRIDPWGGRIQQVVFTSRLLADAASYANKDLSKGGYKNSKGEVTQLGVPFKSPSGTDLVLSQAINKLSPSASLVQNFLSKEPQKDGTYKNQYGKDYSLSSDLMDKMHPIYWGTVSDLYKDDPSALNGLLAFYAFFGGGVNVQDDKKKKK